MNQNLNATGGVDPPAPVVALESDPRLPLVIGVTGHRDLRLEARPALMKCVAEVFATLQAKYPASPLLLLSPLAEGADRLVAEVALGLAVPARLMVPMPMPRVMYETDFATVESRRDFARLLAAAAHSLELPLLPGSNAEQVISDGRIRARQYMAVGEFIARHCQVLIALWDGKPGSPGGTADVVTLKLTGNWPDAAADAPDSIVPRGPVFHIVTPRARNSADNLQVRCAELYPPGENEPADARDFDHFTVLRQLDAYNHEIERLRDNEADAVARAANDLAPGLTDSAACEIAPGLAMIRRHYAMADVLAVHYQRLTVAALFRVSCVVFLGALAFDAALHLLTGERLAVVRALAMCGSPVLMIVAIAIYRNAKSRDYQNKYQDYRALAEGLRVQFFWRLAGVDECVADHYLGRHSAELEWIRDACRSSLAASNCPLGGLTEDSRRIAQARWLDAERSYLERAIASQEHKVACFERRIAFCFWLGLGGVLGLAALLAMQACGDFAFLAPLLGESSPWFGLLLMVITLSAVAAAMLHNYVEKLALRPQLRMYEGMRRIYRRYGDRLRTMPLADYPATLFRVGREALLENGDWVMAHRERPLDVPHH